MTAAATVRALLHTAAFARPAHLWSRTARTGCTRARTPTHPREPLPGVPHRLDRRPPSTRRESSCALDLDLDLKVKVKVKVQRPGLRGGGRLAENHRVVARLRRAPGQDIPEAMAIGSPWVLLPLDSGLVFEPPLTAEWCGN